LWESYGASEQSSNQLQLRSKQPYSDFLAKTYKGEIPPTVCFNVLTPSGWLYAMTKTGDGTYLVRVGGAVPHPTAGFVLQSGWPQRNLNLQWPLEQMDPLDQMEL
jgi:hypothetical protein